MRITRIDFEGKTGYYATAQRKTSMGSTPNVIVITILTPERPNGLEQNIAANSEKKICAAAQRLQHELEGYQGTNSDVHGFYLELLKLSDI